MKPLPRNRLCAIVALITVGPAAAACGGGSGSKAARTAPSAATALPAATAGPASTTPPGPLPSTTIPAPTAPGAKTTTTTSAPSTTTAAPASFTGTVATVSAADIPFSWRQGCPLDPAQLRMLKVGYWGFDNQPHLGAMVVNAAVTGDVLKIFGRLFADHFPIHQMQPIDVYHGSDPASMAADNTSGFNCRYAVAAGPPQWSAHAYGEAIDVNTVENPYLLGGTVFPDAGRAFLDRSNVRPGMAVPGGELVRAFASAGWQWGGRWTAHPDYQHFSKTGG